MLAVARRGACMSQPLLRQSRRQFTCHFITVSRRTFVALAKNKNLLRSRPSDVIDAARRPGRRLGHGKGEAREDYTFTLVRWSKQVWGKMFGKYLLVTNVLGSGILMAVGDVIAQEYEFRRGLRSHDRYDGERVYRMFVAGALQGPLHHFVYNWMDRVMPQRTFRNIINKILIDQLFMSPACILIFFYTVCYLERQTLQATHQELIAKFPYIYLMDWITWPAAQYVNFRYLDTKYRVAFVNVCTAVYNVLMSYMKHDFGIELPMDQQNHLMSSDSNTSKKIISEIPAPQQTVDSEPKT